MEAGTERLRGDRVHLPRESLDAVEWYDGEAIRSVWPTGRDYLVVTNLRCVLLELGDGIRRPSGWRAGAEFAFFNFAEPAVKGLDEVELAEEFFEDRRCRVPVADPLSVCAALSVARAEGRRAWSLRRRAEGVGERLALPTAAPGGARSQPGESGPCPECGNVFRGPAQYCPSCHAAVRARGRR